MDRVECEDEKGKDMPAEATDRRRMERGRVMLRNFICAPDRVAVLGREGGGKRG